MTIDTPTGTINQITPIREFVELTTITNAQYLLGIQNMSTGNGSKITFGNLITSLISGNADNKLVKGSDDKLFISTPIEIGTLANLTTTNKTNLVSAINELNSNMGSLSSLETTVTTNLVAAINSVAELVQPELLLDKVNQSKALVTGNVASYQEELEQIKLMKSSTFDLSKFTVVGTPTITNNGIASGFSTLNYLHLGVINKFKDANTWEVVSPFFKPNSLNNDRAILRSSTITNDTEERFYIGMNIGHPRCAVSINGVRTVIDNTSVTFTTTKWYQIKFKFTGTKYQGYWREKGSAWTLFGEEENSNKLGNFTSTFDICHFPGNDYLFNGTIDLRGISIKFDNNLYYSAHKLGIDTIKNDDFLALGSPKISDEGIAVMNAQTDLLYKDGVTIGSSDTLKINLEFKNLQTDGDEDVFTIRPSSMGLTTTNGYYDSIWIAITGGQVYIRAYSGSNQLGNLKIGNIDFATSYYNQKLKLEMTFSGTTLSANLYRGTTLYTGTAELSSAYTVTDGRVIIGAANWRSNRNVEYDLNSIEIYKNGNLVYQPCLKIPYYESSAQYGSKIVDVQYRGRVLDAYQQGYKDYKYYTLDEENGNFTLPHGEIYGMLEQIRTKNEQNNEAVRQIVGVKDNLYKILEGHQSTNKTLWDLITFTDNTEADNLLIGGDSSFTSNSSGSNFHFYLLNSIIGTNQPDDTAKLNVYKLFNKSHYDAQNDPIYVADGTIVIACANPTKLSKILLRSYDTYYTTPSIIHIHGANITNNMSRDITMTDFTSYAKYIGGISTTKEDTYTTPTNTNWGINRPIELTIDDKDTFNTFFISMSHWCSGQSGWNRRLVGVQIYGTQMTNDDSDYTVKMSGDYENCKWIASNGKIYNTDDLYQQYGYIPKEKVQLSRWISCFGSGIGQANATTRAADQYYPKYISGSISTTKNNGGQPWYFLRQTNYSAEPRPQVGYNVSGQGYLNITSTLNNQTVIDYTADSSFPIGEYYWEGTFGYNQSPTAHNGNTYMCGWCQLQKVYDDNSVEIIQTFSKEGSMFEPSVCYRTPRFYANRAFKKLRLIIKEMAFPNAAMILSQMQLYYRDTAGNMARSFIPNATQYDLSYNTVKHKSNIHFFITPTGVRVGSNCFIEKTDPTTKAACVGNRWINENTKKSYVCNASGVWTEEDFCEIGCMTMFGSKHKGMRLRTVANSENPMQKYIQDHGDMGGNLALDYPLAVNASTVVTSSPTDPDFYFQAESKDENEGIEFSLPANTKTLQSYRRSLVKSKVYQGGQQFAHWSNCDHTGAILKAYKTFDASAVGEYIEGSEEEEQ